MYYLGPLYNKPLITGFRHPELPVNLLAIHEKCRIKRPQFVINRPGNKQIGTGNIINWFRLLNRCRTEMVAFFRNRKYLPSTSTISPSGVINRPYECIFRRFLSLRIAPNAPILCSGFFSQKSKKYFTALLSRIVSEFRKKDNAPLLPEPRDYSPDRIPDSGRYKYILRADLVKKRLYCYPSMHYPPIWSRIRDPRFYRQCYRYNPMSVPVYYN